MSEPFIVVIKEQACYGLTSHKNSTRAVLTVLRYRQKKAFPYALWEANNVRYSYMANGLRGIREFIRAEGNDRWTAMTAGSPGL